MTTAFSDFIQDSDLKSALEQLNFKEPTPIQTLAIPPALRGEDLIIQARTGSGKTLAYAIPLIALSRSLEHKHLSPRVVVLVPTRELALQVRDVIASITAQLPEGKYETPCIIGGADMDAQVAKLETDCRIVVATPGRMMDLMRQKKLKLQMCKLFVLDEADEMLSSGFLEDIRIILSRLPDERQGLFVSATITPRVGMLANSFLEKPNHLVAEAPGEDLPPIEHLYMDVAGDLMAKPNALCDLIETFRPASAIIFCNTKSDTQMVEALLRRRGFEARRLNSDLSQKQREKVIKKIRAKELPILVATDIAARGLDIDSLDMVINFTIHEQPEIYVHRTGRTGRAGKSGIAISLVGPRDFGAFHFLKKVTAAEIKKIELPSDEEISQARLAHLSQMLRESHLKLNDRDRLIAKKLFKESFGEQDIPEEFLETLAKLCSHMMEHHIVAETKALEDEVAGDAEPQNLEERRQPQRHERNERRDGDRRAQGEEHFAQRKESRERDDRQRSDGRRDDRQRDDRERDDRPRDDRPRDRRPHREIDRGPQGSVPSRVFIGQGTEHGMKEADLRALVADLGEVPENQIRGFVIRSNYSLVELESSLAKQLASNLNGISYNGTDLPAEVAIEMVGPKPQRRHNDRHGGGRRGGGNGRRSNDRRRNHREDARR